MRGFFSWLYEEDLLPNNPAKKLKETKVEHRIGLTLQPEEREEIRCQCKNERELAICDFLYSSGVRISELCSLNITDINFNIFFLNTWISKHFIIFADDSWNFLFRETLVNVFAVVLHKEQDVLPTPGCRT